MNHKHSDNPVDFTEMMKEIPVQFDRTITEMAKTAEMIGRAIKTNLNDFSNAASNNMPETSADDTTKASTSDIPDFSSVKTPDGFSGNATNPSNQADSESKSILTLNDMIALLEVNDAVDQLYEALETLIGSVAVSSNDLLHKLNKIISVIVNASAATKPQKDEEPQETGTDDNKWIYQLLDNKTLDNERKAKMLLGLTDR